MIMDKKEKNFATYKEFAKMLREVANIYSKLGDEPLLKEGYEYNAIRDAVQYVTNKHDFDYFIQPWKDEFLRMPFDVTKRKKWADYVAECHATGKITIIMIGINDHNFSNSVKGNRCHIIKI